jgi:hypothetical protein
LESNLPCGFSPFIVGQRPQTFDLLLNCVGGASALLRE